MDGRGFDDVVRRLASGCSRRSVLRGLIGGGAAVAGTQTGSSLAEPADKVSICHYDKETDTYTLLSVSGNAYAVHRAHGDFDPYVCDDGLRCQACPVRQCVDVDPVCARFADECPDVPDCYCRNSVEGERFCSPAITCLEEPGCQTSADCATGSFCTTDTCCPETEGTPCCPETGGLCVTICENGSDRRITAAGDGDTSPPAR
jgi:hypothetical protein